MLRTKEFALRIIKLVDALPYSISGRAIGNQIIRSGTSVGANYRAALKARSNAEFVAKLRIVIEEADETIFWLEIIIDSKMIRRDLVLALLQEAREITAIMVSTCKTISNKINFKS